MAEFRESIDRLQGQVQVALSIEEVEPQRWWRRKRGRAVEIFAGLMMALATAITAGLMMKGRLVDHAGLHAPELPESRYWRWGL